MRRRPSRGRLIKIGKAVKPIKEIEKEIQFLEHVKVFEPRVYVFWMITRYGGYRSTEVLKLKVKDIKRALTNGYFDFSEKKTGKIRHIPLDRDIRRNLKEIIKNKHDEQVLLPSQKGKNQPLGYRQMQRLIVKYGKECLIKDIGCHTPRKTAGFHLFMETGDIYEVKDFLQHASVRDTYAYIDVSDERKKWQLKGTNNPFKKMRG